MSSLCCVKYHEKWFVYWKPVNFIFLDSRDEDRLCSLQTADVFSVVSSLPPNFLISWKERIYYRKYVCGSQTILLRISQESSLPRSFTIRGEGTRDARLRMSAGEAIKNLHAYAWEKKIEFSNWSSCLVETHPHYQPKIPQVQEIMLRTRKSTIKRPVLEQNSLLFIYSKIVVIVQWVALVI